jgi:maleate cis-trans isomerase
MYGWRGRIGLLVPSINTTIEPEFWQLVPEGVSVHSARMDVGGQGTPEALREMEHVANRAAKDVAMTQPDVVVYGCTSGSFFEGPAFNERIIRQLGDIAKVPVVTTAGAMAASLLRAGVKRVNVVTPYVALTNERLKQFLKAFGIEVLRLETFDMLDLFDHAKILPEDVYRKVKAMDSDEAQAVFIACTQVRALEVVDVLERDLGKPVYSANQASLWQAFDVLGIDPGIKHRGSLLRALSERRSDAGAPPAAQPIAKVAQVRG